MNLYYNGEFVEQFKGAREPDRLVPAPAATTTTGVEVKTTEEVIAATPEAHKPPPPPVVVNTRPPPNPDGVVLSLLPSHSPTKCPPNTSLSSSSSSPLGVDTARNWPRFERSLQRTSAVSPKSTVTTAQQCVNMRKASRTILRCVYTLLAATDRASASQSRSWGSCRTS